MKRNSFKKQVKNAQKAILNDSEAWHENFLKNNYPEYSPQKEEKRQKYKVLGISLSSSFVVALIIVLSIIFTLPPDLPNNSKHYLSENERIEDSNLIELNEAIQGISLDINEIYNSLIERIYDSYSNDTLYYKLRLSNEDITYETIMVYVYVNSYYQNRKTLQQEHSIKRLEDFEVRFNENIIDVDWAFTINYTAEIEYKNVDIYISYEQLSLDEESNFFTFVEQFINKN